MDEREGEWGNGRNGERRSRTDASVSHCHTPTRSASEGKIPRRTSLALRAGQADSIPGLGSASLTLRETPTSISATASDSLAGTGAASGKRNSKRQMA